MESITLDLDVATLFAGGRLCLDFVNTSCERRGVEVEFIGDAEALKRWLQQAEGVLEKPLCPDGRVWEEGYGERVLPRAYALRDALRALFLSVIEKTTPSPAAVETVNALLRENPVYSQIESDGAGFRDTIWVRPPEDQWLVRIAQDAIDLLCHSDLSLLRQCECPTCVRVFYDTTKNHKRRWCAEKCGSKPKAAAYYRRKVARAAQARSAEATPFSGPPG